MWWTADPPRPFQLRPVPICSALRFLVAGLLPAFIYRRISRLSQGTAYPYRVTLMVRPLLLAEPGPGDASCTTWTLSVSFHLFTFGRVGLPVNPRSVRLQPCGLRRAVQISRFSSFVSSLATFSARFRSVDPRRPFLVFRPSPSFLRSQPCDWWASV